MLRTNAIGIVVGACLTHFLSVLPDLQGLVVYFFILIVVTATMVCIVYRHRAASKYRPVAILFSLMISVMGAMCWTVYQAQLRLDDRLAEQHENVVTRLSFLITSMAQDQSEQQKFEAKVIDPVTLGIPRHIMVSWPDPPGKRLHVLPGQVWRAALVLKRPHGASNPAGFDFEAHMFQKISEPWVK